jgi:hypothetical protein
MSIHAEISGEAQARLASQRRNSTVASFLISLLVTALIALVLGIFLLPDILKESPTIVTYHATSLEEDTLEKKTLKTTVQRKPSAPAPSTARVITSTTPSPTSIPVPDVLVPTEAVDFGDAQDFGGGWGAGTGFDQGGGATFFNQTVKADRIAYVIDYSGSMKGKKDELMRAELSKSVGGLTAGTKFQMIFFSGPAWVAGSDATAKGSEGLIKGKGGHQYIWTGKGAHDWKPVGKRQEVEWLDMSANQMKESLEVIKKSKLVWGTDWTNPLEMAFDMEPPPQIVFFMTDGQMSGRDMMGLTKDLASKAKKKGIIINSIAMMEPQAEESMFELAERTGGMFTIIDASGEVREVKKLDKRKGKKR